MKTSALKLFLGVCFIFLGFAQAEKVEKPRTLEGLVKQEDEFYKILKQKHPIFKYQKEGRLIGEVKLSDRKEEFMEISGGPLFAKDNGLQHTAVTYRLPYESFLDLPNKFVGPKKCGECHPAQYKAWERSRHAKVVRFPSELTEIDGDMKKPLYNSKATALPMGIEASDVFVMIGTPRTKYGFIDSYLVRGTYHVENGTLSKLTGNLVAGGNQFSRFWAEFLTPEKAKQIASFVPGFPTTMPEFGGSGSYVWGINSYAATYRKKMIFQPASAYCETCHTFKFDFKSKKELYKALGNAKELQKHVISKGISCEECHGAGAHLYGARGAGMPSNCERCHQRFVYNQEDAKLNPKKPFNSYFKSANPACGTEGAQMYSSAHYDKGIRCSTCHDPHEITSNDWKDPYTKTALKKTCKDCHATQASFFKKGGIHAKDNCTSCHMPNMMSCEDFKAIQKPDYAGFDNVRAAHIWNIKVDKTAKTLNPPAGKERSSEVKGWSIARDEEGKFFIDLMWSCGRTSASDINLVGPGASGCHSAVQSTLPKKLHFTNQEMIYDKVMEWQTPVKEGYAKIIAGIKKIDKTLADKPKLAVEKKSQVLLLTKKAEEIAEKLEKDGSWGVHGPAYSKKIIDEALTYVQEAQNLLK